MTPFPRRDPDAPLVPAPVEHPLLNVEPMERLIRHRHSTGDFGSAYFVMNPGTFAELLAHWHNPHTDCAMQRVEGLFGIPVVTDPSREPRTWTLETGRGGIIAEGRL